MKIYCFVAGNVSLVESTILINCVQKDSPTQELSILCPRVSQATEHVATPPGSSIHKKA
jgi:hypothetical protein